MILSQNGRVWTLGARTLGARTMGHQHTSTPGQTATAAGPLSATRAASWCPLHTRGAFPDEKSDLA
jgi:hypothetical protein